MENIIINGHESQLPFGKWFLEYMADQADEEVTFTSLEDTYSFFSKKEVKEMAKEYFEEMFYNFKKIANGMIYVTCEDEDF